MATLAEHIYAVYCGDCQSWFRSANPKSCPSCGTKINDNAPPPKPDMVNQPPHYIRGGMEAIDVIDAFGGPDPEHYKSTALAYILRAGRKGDEIEDLEKAIWYLTRRVKNLRSHKSNANKL